MARGLDISVCEIVAFEQQRLTFSLLQAQSSRLLIH
jgi:hypothetical protein